MALFIAGFGVFLFGPLLVLALWSVAGQWFFPSPLPTEYTLNWYNFALNVPGVLSSLVVSLVVAVAAVVATTLIALAAAFAVARFDFRGRKLIRGLFALPLMVPYIAIGLGIAVAFSQLRLVGTLQGILLAHLIATLPYGLLILTASVEALDRSVEEAAAACGASPRRTFFTVTLAQLSPAIMAQAIFVFTISMDEFPLSLLVSGADVATLPVRIFGVITSGYLQASSALSILLLLPSFLLAFFLGRHLKPENLSMGGV